MRHHPVLHNSHLEMSYADWCMVGKQTSPCLAEVGSTSTSCDAPDAVTTVQLAWGLANVAVTPNRCW